MNLVRIARGEVAERDVGELPALLAGGEGVVWLDMSAGDPDMQAVLSDVFEVRGSALRECEQPGLVPRVRRYDTTLRRAARSRHGDDGVLDTLAVVLFVGDGYVVTVHVGPRSRRARPPGHGDMLDGWATPVAVESSADLAHAIAWRSATDGERGGGAVQPGGDASAGMASRRRDQELLESMIAARHELVTIQTMASHDRSIFGGFRRGWRSAGRPGRLVDDMVDQFGHSGHVPDRARLPAGAARPLPDTGHRQHRPGDGAPGAITALSADHRVASVYGVDTIVT